MRSERVRRAAAKAAVTASQRTGRPVNVSDPAVVFFANMEWGTADLSARVSTPLSVVVPAGGWV